MTAIYEQLQHDWPHHQLPSAPADPPEDAVSLTTFEADMKADLEHLEAGVRAFAERHLPLAAEAASLADRAVNSNLVQIALKAALPPDIEAGFVTAIEAIDSRLKAEEAAQAVAEPPADPSPDAGQDPAAAAPSGPVTGGQAS